MNIIHVHKYYLCCCYLGLLYNHCLLQCFWIPFHNYTFLWSLEKLLNFIQDFIIYLRLFDEETIFDIFLSLSWELIGNTEYELSRIEYLEVFMSDLVFDLFNERGSFEPWRADHESGLSWVKCLWYFKVVRVFLWCNRLGLGVCLSWYLLRETRVFCWCSTS